MPCRTPGASRGLLRRPLRSRRDASKPSRRSSPTDSPRASSTRRSAAVASTGTEDDADATCERNRRLADACVGAVPGSSGPQPRAASGQPTPSGASSPRVANYMPFGLRVQPRSAVVRWRSSVRSRAPGSAAEPPMLVVRSTTNRLWRPRGNEHLVVDQPAAIEPTCEEGEGTGRPGSGRSSVPIAPRPSALPSAPRAGSPAESGSWPCPEIRDRH